MAPNDCLVLIMVLLCLRTLILVLMWKNSFFRFRHALAHLARTAVSVRMMVPERSNVSVPLDSTDHGVNWRKIVSRVIEL